MSIKILSPFGPRMAKLSLPNTLLNLINKEVDRIISNKILSKQYNYSKKLAGEVEQEIELPKTFVHKFLKKFFESNIRDFVKQSTGKVTKKIILKNFWVVRQFANDYNPIHFHDGDISGVGYLQLPKNLNKSKKNTRRMGLLILSMEVGCC